MKILLVYPNHAGMNMLPPAIALFSSLLKDRGHKVDLFDTTSWPIPGETDFNSDKQKERLLTARPFDERRLQQNIHTGDVREAFRQKVRIFNPGLIAVSVTEDLFPIAKYLLDALEPNTIPTIMGGVFPTFAPNICLALKNVDMICIGEGEDAIVNLAERMEQGKDYSDIPNIWLKKGGKIIRNPLGVPTNIDNNPLMDFSLFEDARLYRPMQGRVWRMLPVETHRGCPYQCTYCNSPSQAQLYRKETGCRFFRRKSFEALHRELKYYKDVIRAEAFYFWADTFMAYSEKEFDEFCEMYKEIALPFWCQARPEEIKEYRIRKLMKIGLFRMGIGIEHGNEEFRTRVLKRKMSNKLIIDNLKILNRCELKFSVNNIIGFPTETRELAIDTIKLNRLIDADNANAYSFSPFHGTPLRKMAEQLGFCDPNLIARSIMRPTLLNMPHFTPEQIEGLRRCFILYVKMPINRWPEISEAEKLTPAGDKIWNRLRDECAEKYMNF